MIISLLILPVLILGCTYFYTKSQPRIYSSSALIVLDKKTALNAQLGEREDSPVRSVDLQTEFEIIQSKKILLPVLEEQKFGESLVLASGLLADTYSGKEDFLYKRFKAEHLRVHPYRNTHFIEITVFSEEPRQAKNTANAMARNYIDYRKGETGNVFGVDLISEAEEGVSPIKPNFKLNVALALVIGFVVGGIFSIALSIWYFATKAKPPALPRTPAAWVPLNSASPAKS